MHIFIVPKGKGKYNAYLEDGPLVAQSTTTPLFASARALKESGVPDETELTLSHAGSSTISIRSTVGKAASLTVEDTDRDGIRFRKFRPGAKPGAEHALELRFSHPRIGFLRAPVG